MFFRRYFRELPAEETGGVHMTGSEKKQMVLAVGTILAGMLIIFLIIFGLQFLLGFAQAKNAPPGCQIIRPPGEVYTIFIDNTTIWTG